LTQIIEVIFSSTGATRIQTLGFSGSCCQDASRFLERALGTCVIEQRTAEFYEATNNQHTMTERSDGC
jgi:hypothetical protein